MLPIAGVMPRFIRQHSERLCLMTGTTATSDAATGSTRTSEGHAATTASATDDHPSIPCELDPRCPHSN